MDAVIVIPARWGASRFPGKALARIGDDTLIGHVIRRAKDCRRAAAVWIATDDERIAAEAERHAVGAVLPPGDFASGTDRIAAALDEIETRAGIRYSQVINVQGDEPLLDVGAVDAMIGMLQQSGVDLATLCCPIRGPEEHLDPNVVKVVLDAASNALYFSRAPIPAGSWQQARRHVGIYGYQTPVLRAFAAIAPTPLERAERLEQLRALENGFTIRVVETSAPHLGVDSPEDVRKIEQELARLR
ncbi:MAG TPA: 3-deoxy-manno-octulosonate cytidylyltransferase [Thermoanaerobaculia bacterium]|nr:3-deoxy-manno-octulosonate cytidylyltransferase [Thermoanaerobaculia bacterium]